MAQSTLKTYVLLDEYDATAPIYQRVNKDTRVRLQKRPIDHAYLKVTFYDNKTQKSRTARLKLGSSSIWQDEQIKEGIPANEPFTNAERKAVQFNYGVLRTKNPLVQLYIETIPSMEGFDGECDAVKKPLYKLYDKTGEIKTRNAAIKKRLEAGNRIEAITELREAQDLMIRLNGSFFTPPDSLEECQNQLFEFLDDADDDMLEKLMQDKVSKDEEIMITVGRAVAAGIISYTQKMNYVSMKKGTEWVDVKVISNQLPPSERERQFMEFLSTNDGDALYTDIQIKLAESEGKVRKTKKKTDLEEVT